MRSTRALQMLACEFRKPSLRHSMVQLRRVYIVHAANEALWYKFIFDFLSTPAADLFGSPSKTLLSQVRERERERERGGRE